MKFLEMKAWSLQAAKLALLALFTLGAEAAALQVEALSLPYASPWQRATPQQENEDDALLLAADSSLRLALPRRTRLLKIDADTYYAKLRASWQKLYGDSAKISWFAVGGVDGKQKWLLCRRPSRDETVSVFHLSTVFAGRAYSVLLFAPRAAAALPQVALALLAEIRFAGEATPLLAGPDWVKTREIYPQANADVLEALVQDDVVRLGDDGLVTGYGLDFAASSLAWFIEGYQWKTIAKRVMRVDWKQGGHLAVRADTESTVWPVQLTLTEDEADVRASLRVILLCAPAHRISAVLEQLQLGARQPLQRLLLEPAAGCPAVLPERATPSLLAGVSGKTVQADLVLSLPPRLDAAALAALQQAGLSRIGLVEIALVAGPRRTGFGDRLIERARWYVVFEPVESAAAR